MAKRDYRTDTIYVYSDGTVFVTPDGIGRVFYDGDIEAQDDTGLDKVVYLNYVYTSWDSGQYDPDEDE